MPIAAGKGGSTRAPPVSLMPVTRAVLLTKEDLENFRNHATNKDSVGSLLPLGSCGHVLPVSSAPPVAPSTAQGPPPAWPPPPRRRTRSASARRKPRTSAEVAAPVPNPHALPSPCATPGNNMVFYNATQVASAGNVPSALVCDKQNGLIPTSAIKKPSRVVRAKTLSRMDRISPEPPLAQGSSDSPGLVLQGHDIRRMCRGDFPEPKLPEVSQSECAEATAAARLKQFLQVSGCTALVPVTADVVSTPFEDEWSSSGSDGESDGWDLRQHRYARSNPSAPTASSLAAPVAVLARKWRKAAQSRANTVEGLEDAVVAWPASSNETVYVASEGHRLLGDESDDDCPENIEKDERRDLEALQKIANALVVFYGLKDAKRAIRFKSNVVNVVMVTEEAWQLKERQSPLDEPPVFWLRGNRVYDFHGDRGTVAEFEADLLTRQVEDDAACRSRRQKQGLLPFPFLPLPQKEKVEDDDDRNDAVKAARR